MSTSSEVSGPLRLAIGVPTHRRPDRLARLLPLLDEQARALLDTPTVVSDVRIHVVDNDPDASARDVVAAWPGDAAYHHEPRRGISYARNTVLDAAVDADVLVFIDDDETPAPGWLTALEGLRASTGAAAVAGRVVSEPDGRLDPFVAAGGFLDRAHRHGVASGTPITRAATNNLLLDLRFVRRLGLRFDLDFGLTGGEDSLFTSALVAAGGLMVWCPEATVHDHVPADRMTPDYMLARARAMSNSGVFVELALRDRPTARSAFRVRHGARELARLAQGSALVAAGRLRGSLSAHARGRRALARSTGSLSALVGRRTRHYAPAPADGADPSPTPPATEHTS